MLHCNPEFLHVVRPKTPRGDGNHRGSPALDHAPLVVSSDPKPREGTETFCLMLGRQLLTKSSDPKPREGTETRKRRASSDRLLVVRPKTPRGDGNMCAVAVSAPRPVSSDPKPREGTETFRRQFVDHEFSESSDPKPREGTETHPTRYRWRASFIESSDPKPREGTETHIGDGDAARGHAESSDPKPREGTETTPRVVPSVSVLLVVRPKTPRGDGNA
ncbi:Uncharacterised protein [Mycobacterium tuberculosis]|nr:Uncharacterised protein [Mycobacterium tuberculosis]